MPTGNAIVQQIPMTKMNAELLRIICEHSTPSEVLNVAKSCKKMKSKVEKIFSKIYVNVAPNTDPIALFKHLSSNKFILEDPGDIFNPERNHISRHFLDAQAKQCLDFEGADWEYIFQFATMQHELSAETILMLVPERSRNFLDRLAEAAAHNINVTSESFRIAIMLDNPKVARILLEHDDPAKWVNTPDYAGWLPLFHAIYSTRQAIAQVLIDYGADPHKPANRQYYTSTTPMQFCKQALSINSGYAKKFIPLKAIEKMMVESQGNLKRLRNYV
jgi:hypothetical protein